MKLGIKAKVILLFSSVIVMGTIAMGTFAIWTVRTQILSQKILASFLSQEQYGQLVYHFELRIILFGFFGLVVAIVASWFVAHYFARNLLKLIDIADRVANGDLTVRQITVKSTDEIGKLTASFNTMIENLKIFVKVSNLFFTCILGGWLHYEHPKPR